MLDTLLATASLRDVIDIGLLAFIIYQALRLIQGTRAWQMTFGVIGVILFYYVANQAGLRTLSLLLQNFIPYFVFALLVIFQSEIRRALAKIGRTRFVGLLGGKRRPHKLEEVVLAATELSSKRIGALIVLEKDIGLKNYIESGILLDANLTYDLLLTIFNPRGPLHDGAVIIAGERILAAGCFLPLTTDPYLSKELGTRHRAAIGMTAETDSVAVVVSEETGTISIVQEGEMTRNLDSARLMKLLDRALESTPPTPQREKNETPEGTATTEQESGVV